MKKRFLKVALFFLCIFISVGISAQKLGYIDSQEILLALPEVKEANSNIEAFQSQMQRKGQEMIQALQTKYQNIEQTRDNLSPLQLEEEARKLKEEETKILEFEQTSMQKIYEKSEALLAPIRDRVQNAINAVAKENGYDYVFDYSTGIVLYADQSVNLGPLVKSKLGI